MKRLALALFLFAVAPAPPALQAPWFFLQLSDPQFGMYTEDASFVQESANFEFAIATANRLRPAFVVVTGDLVNKPGDAAQVAEYKRIAAKLDPAIPLYNVAGNHDVGNKPDAASVSAYRNGFGRDYYSFRVGDFLGIVLDSSLIGAPNASDWFVDQERWLRAELERARADRARHVVVFQHIPWFLADPEEPDQYFNISIQWRKPYLAMLHDAGVQYVFAGHYHRNALARDGSLEMIVTGPVGKPLGGAKSGFRVAIVRDDGIEHQYYELGDVPNRIDVGRP